MGMVIFEEPMFGDKTETQKIMINSAHVIKAYVADPIEIGGLLLNSVDLYMDNDKRIQVIGELEKVSYALNSVS